ncbi:MAG: leucine-rich repeat domain-containing protein, partial [Alistipes sp.]|nr:leucine-rich repeat domain-containing protein [Alistipes sp.]
TNVIKELNLSNNTNLVALDARRADIQSLNISGCTKLESMDISENYLVTLDLSTNISLKKLDCWNNAIEVLDVSNCPALTSLDCSPMSTLETVYVDATQKINYITYNRSNSYIPDATSVVVR